MTITRANSQDLEEILKLQYLAYQSEAELVGSRDIQSLRQSLPEVEEEFQRGMILKAVGDGGCIVGSVRGRLQGDTLHIGKLFVHPEFRGRGLGARLLQEMEQRYPGVCYELFTSSLSGTNLGMYQRRGYVEIRRERAVPGMEMVFLRKACAGTC